MPEDTQQPSDIRQPTVIPHPIAPAAEPKDMFADVDEQEPTVMPSTMLSSAQPAVGMTTEPSAAGYTFEEEEPRPWYLQKKFIVLLLGVLLLLIVIIFGVQFAMRLLAPTPQQPAAVSTPPASIEQPAAEQFFGQQEPATTEQPETTQEAPIPEPTVPVAPTEGQPTVLEVDTDADGLIDSEEQALGTSITVTDTDGDGLSDREEFRVFGTDPLNPDSDGDTYLDGVEVKNGYNPRGEGKLFTIPTE